MRLDTLLAESRHLLDAAGVSGAALDSRLLTGGLLALSTAQMITGGDRDIGADDVGRVRAAMARRAAGEPVHRILGRRAFHGVSLALSPATLEPRPDTEALVDLALSLVPSLPQPLRILDLGTGTGAILLALLQEIAEARGLGIDISAEAVATASANAAANGMSSRAEFAVSDWFAAVPGTFGLIVSNPPYIPSGEIGGLQKEVRLHDPAAALDGGPDGLEPYRVIAASARGHLAEGGVIAVEHGFDQAAAVAAIFADHGFCPLARARDHGGHDRTCAFAADTAKG